MSKSLKSVNNHAHDQKESAADGQIQNHEGGFVFEVSPKTAIERFLILGTDGGSYYVGEKDFVKESVNMLKDMIAKHETLVRETMVDVAVNNRAFRVSPAIFTAAMLHTYGQDKAAIRAALPLVLRTSTHLFEYSEYVKNLGGWGRSKRGAVKDWYESKSVDQLAYQLVKYRQRNGWTHRDMLRISHAQPAEVLAQFALGKLDDSFTGEVPSIIEGFRAAQAASNAKEAIAVLNDYPRLPWEALPTSVHKDVDVWKTLFRNGSLKGTAALRNVVRLAKLDAFKDLDFALEYAAELSTPEAVKASRLHPLAYLNAQVAYTRGQVDRNAHHGWGIVPRNKTWESESMIAKALEDGFYTAFENVEPAGKRTMVALDVSGSMGSVAKGTDLSCAEVGAVMSMVVARTEPKSMIRGFTDRFVDLEITANDSFEVAAKKAQKNNFGGTDCSLPMLWALERNVEIDTFAVITDNETYAGGIHPFEALKKYRKATGIDARLGVFAVEGNPFSIADPSDRGMMDFVGFDASAPKVFADFSAGRI